MEDRLGADINKLSDELNAELARFKKEREQERETRTAGLVEAQQATEAALKALGSGVAAEAIVFAETGEVLVPSGEKAPKGAPAQLRRMTAELVERINTDIQERESQEEAAVRQRIEDARLEMSAALEAEQERLRSEAEGLKEEIGAPATRSRACRRATCSPRPRSTAGTTASSTASTAAASAAASASSARAWARRPCASASRGSTSKGWPGSSTPRCAPAPACAARRPSSGCASSRPSAAPARAPSG